MLRHKTSKYIEIQRVAKDIEACGTYNVSRDMPLSV